MRETLKEYEVWTADQKECVDMICGYGKADALRVCPKYDSPEFLLIGGWEIE